MFNLDPLKLVPPGTNFSEIFGPPPEKFVPTQGPACESLDMLAGCIKDIFAFLAYRSSQGTSRLCVRASVQVEMRALETGGDRAMRTWSFKQHSPSPKGPKI